MSEPYIKSKIREMELSRPIVIETHSLRDVCQCERPPMPYGEGLTHCNGPGGCGRRLDVFAKERLIAILDSRLARLERERKEARRIRARLTRHTEAAGKRREV